MNLVEKGWPISKDLNQVTIIGKEISFHPNNITTYQDYRFVYDLTSFTWSGNREKMEWRSSSSVMR